jgi:hypothetical protein
MVETTSAFVYFVFLFVIYGTPIQNSSNSLVESPGGVFLNSMFTISHRVKECYMSTDPQADPRLNG